MLTDQLYFYNVDYNVDIPGAKKNTYCVIKSPKTG